MNLHAGGRWMGGPPPPATDPTWSALLPSELRTFESAGPSTSLSVRGAPGSGKTTLALGMLAAFRGSRTLITTRVPLGALQTQYPWLSDARTPQIDVLEFVRYRQGGRKMDVSVDQMRETLQSRASDLVDVSQVLNLPAPLADRLATLAPGPHLIVVDSWEAWIENVLGTSTIRLDSPTTRWELERSMLDHLLGTGASVLMVLEREDRSRFDYLVDGSVALTSEEVDGRVERWIELGKMRGVRIRSRSYPFTLEAARFRAVALHPGAALGPARAQPDPTPGAPTLWPGSVDFAGQFGRLPTSGPLLLDTDAETPARTVWRLLSPLMESAIRSGGRIVVRSSGVMPPTEIWSTFQPLGTPAAIVGAVRIVAPAAGGPPEGAPPEVFLPAPTDPDLALGALAGGAPPPPDPARVEAALQAPFTFLESGAAAGVRNLLVLFPSLRDDLRPQHVPDPYLLLGNRARRRGVQFSSIVVMPSHDPFLPEVQSRAPVHIGIRTRRGRAFVYGTRPWTPMLLLNAEPSVDGEGPDHSPFGLIAMV